MTELEWLLNVFTLKQFQGQQKFSFSVPQTVVFEKGLP
jgi:hypothetical protein